MEAALFMLAGALGNSMTGYYEVVVDFIDFRLINFAFNIADSSSPSGSPFCPDVLLEHK